MTYSILLPVVLGALATLGAVAAGWVFHRRFWLREQKLRIYSAYFAEATAFLQALVLAAANQEGAKRQLTDAALPSFERAYGELLILGSGETVAIARAFQQETDKFAMSRINLPPPGPAPKQRDLWTELHPAMSIAGLFAEEARRDLTTWRRLNPRTSAVKRILKAK